MPHVPPFYANDSPRHPVTSRSSRTHARCPGSVRPSPAPRLARATTLRPTHTAVPPIDGLRRNSLSVLLSLSPPLSLVLHQHPNRRCFFLAAPAPDGVGGRRHALAHPTPNVSLFLGRTPSKATPTPIDLSLCSLFPRVLHSFLSPLFFLSSSSPCPLCLFSCTFRPRTDLVVTLMF